MKWNLKALFAVVAIAAALFAWLAQRQTPRFPGVLVQLVPTGTTASLASVGNDFEEDFYRQLIALLKRDHPELLDEMWEPETDLRRKIRVTQIEKDSNVRLVTIHAWGNPITDDDVTLKAIFASAIDSLNALRSDAVRSSTDKTS